MLSSPIFFIILLSSLFRAVHALFPPSPHLSPPTQSTQQVLSGDDSDTHFSRNPTSNFLFSSIASLLQQWPNTRYRNGHTMIFGTIPVGTVLYDSCLEDSSVILNAYPLDTTLGSMNKSQLSHNGFPPIGNILGSFAECLPRAVSQHALKDDQSTQEYHLDMFSFAVQEPLRILYFDGSSAANSVRGHLDSQDLITYGRVRPDRMWAEGERISRLCNWGNQYKIDAYVRMEPGFEVMLCDFSRKVSVASRLHIVGGVRPSGNSTSPKEQPSSEATTASAVEDSPGFDHPLVYRQFLRQHRPSTRWIPEEDPSIDIPDGPYPAPTLPPPPSNQTIPPNWRGSLQSINTTALEALQAAAWNALYPGEARVKLDYSKFISFYNPRYTSLVHARAQVKSRPYHRLTYISPHDKLDAMTELKELAEQSETDRGSGVDWQTLVRVVVDRYQDRLEALRDILATPISKTENSTGIATRARTQVQLMLSAYIVLEGLPKHGPDTNTVDRQWADRITHDCVSGLTAGLPNNNRLTSSEVLIKTAVVDVLSAICSTAAEIWTEAFTVEDASTERASQLLTVWRSKVRTLMDWLDWHGWSTCRPICGFESFCYISTWPLGVEWREPEDKEIDITPRCVKKVNGYIGPPWINP